MNDRIKEVRKALELSQEEFGKKLGVSRGVIVNMELSRAEIKPLFIEHLCSVFNVNEEWLRNGTGEMFTEPEYFSLDEYAKNKGLTALELDIIRAYMELDPATRSSLMNLFKTVFKKQVAEETANELDIDREVESYRRELEIEKDTKMSSASQNTDENAG